MRRGDLITVAASSVVICQRTPQLVDAPDFRVTIDPESGNGLRVTSQVMADKPVTVRRERIGQKIGHLGSEDIAGARLRFTSD